LRFGENKIMVSLTPVTLDRRQFAALSALLAVALPGMANAQEAEKPAIVDPAQLMAAQALPDQVQGNALAKVTVIEYASMMCGHCAQFHETTYPVFKKKYVDTGQVRYILREFPLDPIAAASFMLARCSKEKYFEVVDIIFKNQRAIASAEKPDGALLEFLKPVGFTQESFNACLKDEKLYGDVLKVKDGGTGYGVNATPTFFINGQRFSGALEMAAMEKIIDPLLATN
jgi:protein-disulfide isomerase